jgi:hypothetical protein
MIATDILINNLKAVEMFHLQSAKEAARQRQQLEGSGIPSSSRKGKGNSELAAKAGIDHFKKVLAQKNKKQ